MYVASHWVGQSSLQVYAPFECRFIFNILGPVLNIWSQPLGWTELPVCLGSFKCRFISNMLETCLNICRHWVGPLFDYVGAVVEYLGTRFECMQPVIGLDRVPCRFKLLLSVGSSSTSWNPFRVYVASQWVGPSSLQVQAPFECMFIFSILGTFLNIWSQYVQVPLSLDSYRICWDPV